MSHDFCPQCGACYYDLLASGCERCSTLKERELDAIVENKSEDFL